jgi:hypothetical protein
MNKQGSTSIFLIIVVLLLGAGYLVNKGIIVINLPEDFSIITAPTSKPVVSTVPSENSEEEFCQKEGTDIKLSLSEAKEIAILGECGNKLKDTYICNEVTGTWWINLDIEREGCNPACVIDVETKIAEINWRCTGLLPI